MSRSHRVDTAISATPSTLPGVLATMDPGRMLYGSDYPFMPDRGVYFVNSECEDYKVDKKTRAGTDPGNAEKLFPWFAR